MMEKLKVLSLFSGIGGIDLGLERTGFFETVAFCEIDKNCHKVLNKHWPEVPIYEDVTNLDMCSLQHAGFEQIDVICGGFPCQDISVAGKQKGLINEEGKITRSGLWFEYKRLIEEIKPRWVVIENVRNLLSNGLGTVLQDLSEIGYNAEWEIISARDVGACHLRERVWIVAYPNGKPIRKQPISQHGIESSTKPGDNGEERNIKFPDSNDFRFWPAFTSEEEKLQWWSVSTASVRNWWKVEPTICRVDDGIRDRLHKDRPQRIKQLGNSVVPAIPQIIAERIIFHEATKCL